MLGRKGRVYLRVGVRAENWNYTAEAGKKSHHQVAGRKVGHTS